MNALIGQFIGFMKSNGEPFFVVCLLLMVVCGYLIRFNFTLRKKLKEAKRFWKQDAEIVLAQKKAIKKIPLDMVYNFYCDELTEFILPCVIGKKVLDYFPIKKIDADYIVVPVLEYINGTMLIQAGQKVQLVSYIKYRDCAVITDDRIELNMYEALPSLYNFDGLADCDC